MLKSNSDLEYLHYTPLSSLAEIVMGQSPDSKFVNDEQLGSPFLQGNGEFTTKYPKPIHWVTHPGKMAKKGDILISVRAPVGEINIADQDYCIGRGLAAIRFKNRIDPDYGWYAISCYKGQINRFAQGSTFLAVNSNDIRSIEIPMLEESEQRKIAEILTTVDDAIEQTEALIRKYQRIKQGLMQDLLTRGIDSTSSYNKRNEKRSLRELADIYYGKSPKEFRIHSSDYPIFGTGGQVGYAEKPLFKGPAIIVGRKGTLGNPIFTNRDFWAIDTTYAVKPKLGVDAKWLYYNLLNYDLIRLNEATGVPSINREFLYDINFYYFDPEEQKQIAEVIDGVDVVLESNQVILRKYNRLKRGLMQDLLTGKVRVNALLEQ